MKPKLYIETTVISYLVAHPSKHVILAGQQEVTRRFWEDRMGRYEPYISAAVLEEIREGDAEMARFREAAIAALKILPATGAAFDLADHLVRRRVIPEKAHKDAMHIAIAAIHGMEFLVTWNCRHIANAAISRRVADLMRSEGLQLPVLCTP
ncbi:type II toxin-antitoxin system VapC family toxin, partial [Candidatus Sumerlaeota bacterium]|nr:type II toxin-antitoxin system VapC family toxin [Candidatus Sumerlaeota bacterium]